jgi:rod shape-determining protein MreD
VVASQVPVFGAIADLTPLVVMAVALLCGSLTGAVLGFATGLMIDVALLQTMGLTSLVLIGVGYWTGRLRELRDPQSPLAPLALGAGAAAIATIGYGIGQFLLGVDAPLSWLLVKQTLATIVLDALLAIPVTALVRRWLTPVLPEDPRRRRRRAYTTGGLSPLQKA